MASLAQAACERTDALDKEIAWQEHEPQYMADGVLCLRTKKGKEVLVDGNTYCKYFRTNVSVHASTGYAQVGTNLYLHCLVQPCPPGFNVINHWNQNKLDNCGKILRPTTWAENNRNQKARSSTSKVGVST